MGSREPFSICLHDELARVLLTQKRQRREGSEEEGVLAGDLGLCIQRALGAGRIYRNL